MWAGLGGLGRLRYQKSEGGSMFSMARGLFPDSLTKICDLTNTPNMCVVILTGKAPLLAIMNTFKCKKCTQQ